MRRSLRLSVLAAATAILLAPSLPVGAAPAAAAPPRPPQLVLQIPSGGMPAGVAGGKVVTARYGVSYGPFGVYVVPPPREVTITVDASSGAESLRITVAKPTPGCTWVAAVLTCRLPVRHADWTRNTLPLRYIPTPAAQPGTQVPVEISIAAPGFNTASTRGDLTLTGPLPDFSAASFHVENVRPGSLVPSYPSFANVGNAAASGLVLNLPWPSGPGGRRFRNCYYDDNLGRIQCPFPGFTMAPGDRATVSRTTPVLLPVDRSVPSLSTQFIGYSVEPLPAGTPFDPGDAVPGTGPPLRLDRLATTLADAPDADLGDNRAFIYLHTTHNTADVAASADPVRGQPGETVPMTLRLVNHGPATVPGTFGQDERWDAPQWATLTVDVPDGVEVVETSCFAYTGNVVGDREPGHRRYRCIDTGGVAPDTQLTAWMQVKILSAGHHTGEVVAAGGTRDPVRHNNIAVIQVNPS